MPATGAQLHPRIVSGRPRLSGCYPSYMPPLPTASPRAIRTCFLDRDGVLNRKMPEGQYVTAWEEFEILPGVPQAILRLNRAGIRVIVVSNQRGIAKGLYTAADLDTIHARFQAQLQTQGAHIDHFYYCPHDQQSCNCRKPLPGMFEQAQRDFIEIKASSSAMIGDSLADMEFGRRLGMTTILIDVHPDNRAPGVEEASARADLRFASLAEAVDALLTARQ